MFFLVSYLLLFILQQFDEKKNIYTYTECVEVIITIINIVIKRRI